MVWLFVWLSSSTNCLRWGWVLRRQFVRGGSGFCVDGLWGGGGYLSAVRLRVAQRRDVDIVRVRYRGEGNIPRVRRPGIGLTAYTGGWFPAYAGCEHDVQGATMAVLVLGGAGYIGSHMVDRLVNTTDEKVVVVDSLVTGHRAAVNPAAKFYQGDIADQDFMRTVFKENPDVDAVIHFAAYSLVAESMKKPLKYFDNNTAGMIKLLEVMNEVGVKNIVFSSTAATYGIPEKMPIRETDPQKPINPYGESKLMMEKIMHWSDLAYGIKFVALRYFNVAGAKPDGSIGEDHNPETHLLPIVLQVAQGKRDMLKIFGNDYNTPDGTNVRDYVHPYDLADAHILAVKYLREGNESSAFNLGSSTGFSNLQILEAARRVTGKEIPAEMAPRRPGDPDTLIAASDKAREVLGWKPQFDNIDKIIASAWAWHSSHPEGYGDRK